jgi:hypothetical protein
VKAARLAIETELSERTHYRDIDSLGAGGELIDGACFLENPGERNRQKGCAQSAPASRSLEIVLSVNAATSA